MRLSPEEQTWLDAFRRAARDRYPGLIDEMVVFGSKARGDAGPDSDLDVLVILREGDDATKQGVRLLGHRLAVESDALPSIMVYTRAEWTRRERGGSPLYRAVQRDGIRVA